MMSDEEVLQKVVKLRAVGLNTTVADDHKAVYVQVDVDRKIHTNKCQLSS